MTQPNENHRRPLRPAAAADGLGFEEVPSIISALIRVMPAPALEEALRTLRGRLLSRLLALLGLALGRALLTGCELLLVEVVVTEDSSVRGWW